MQRCNRIYTLKNRLKDETGITLVELIAAISLLMIVILLAGAIHMFGQKQFKIQTDSASQANDFSFALTDMTTELRKYEPKDVTVDGQKIKINNNIVYELEGTNLWKNGTSIASSVGDFQPIKPENANFIEIKITKVNQTASSKDYHTRIYFRGVPNEETE